MTTCRLLLVLLVLLQSGLAGGYAQPHPECGAHADTPHLHAGKLLDLPSPGEDEPDPDDHDADAVYLPDAVVAGAPPAPESVPPGFVLADRVRTADEVARPFPLGVPPATAGPRRPLYLLLCTLTI